MSVLKVVPVRMLAVIPDEDLKMDLYSMELSADECEQLEKTGFSLWD